MVNLLILKEHHSSEVLKLCKEIGFPIFLNYIYLMGEDRRKNKDIETQIEKINTFFTNNGFHVVCDYLNEGRYRIILGYDKKQAYRLSSLYHNFISQFPYFILGIGFESYDIHCLYNSFQITNLAINLAFYDEHNIVM